MMGAVEHLLVLLSNVVLHHSNVGPEVAQFIFRKDVGELDGTQVSLVTVLHRLPDSAQGQGNNACTSFKRPANMSTSSPSLSRIVESALLLTASWIAFTKWWY